MTVATISAVSPKEALNALFARGQRLDPSFHWQDVWQEEHADTFTVARSTGFDVLTDIYAAVEKALSEGQTIRQATKDLTPILQAKGWWGKQWTTDPQTGEEVVSQLGSPGRLQTIFQANLRVSYAAGHWSQFEANKAVRPYLLYGGINDAHTRPTHRAHFGLCLPVDDPYWDIWAPPCGWGCRCHLQSLSEGDVRRMRGQIFFTSPNIGERNWTNKRTGEVSKLPDGIDPGWGYNPGKAGSRAASAYADKLVAAPPEIAAAAVSAPSWPPKPLADEFERWVQSLSQGRAVQNSMFTVGAIDQKTLQALARAGIEPQSGAITVSQSAIGHALRDVKSQSGSAIALADLQRMPDLIARPSAVLLDRRDGSLIYVFDAGNADQRGKLVIRIDFAEKARPPGQQKQTIVTNAFRTAGIVETRNLADTNVYQLLTGSL